MLRRRVQVGATAVQSSVLPTQLKLVLRSNSPPPRTRRTPPDDSFKPSRGGELKNLGRFWAYVNRRRGNYSET